ncbi:hypothetical protein Tco_0506153 [Tanacetum coccineum]
MQIPTWMITDEMKQTEHYRMYAEVFGIDVPLTQSQPTESTHGTHRITSAPRSPKPDKEAADRKEQEARENVALVDEHLASEEIEKMVDGQENIVDDSSIPKNNEPNIPGTRIEPRSNKESPEVEITKDKEVEITKDKEVEITKDKEVEITKETPVVEITNVVIPVNARFMPSDLHDVMVETLPTMVDKHIKEHVMKQVPGQLRNQVPVYVAEGLILERQKAKEETEILIAKAILQERGNIQAQISTQIENAIANVIPSQVDTSVRRYMSGHILYVHPAQSQTSSVPDQQYQLYLAMKVDPQLQQQDIAIWLSSGQVFQEEQAPSTSGNQEQDDDFDF